MVSKLELPRAPPPLYNDEAKRDVGAIPFFKRSLKKKNDAVLLQPRLRLFHGVRLATVLREREVLGRTKASTARPADHISHLSCADIQILHILPAGQHLFFWGGRRSDHNPTSGPAKKRIDCTYVKLWPRIPRARCQKYRIWTFRENDK